MLQDSPLSLNPDLVETMTCSEDIFKDYTQYIDEKYHQAVTEIKKKKEKEDMLKLTCDKLNDILDKLQITDTQFEIGETNKNQEIDDMFRIIFKQKNLKIYDTIQNIIREILTKTKSTLTDIQLQIFVKEPERPKEYKSMIDKRKYSESSLSRTIEEKDLYLSKDYTRHSEKIRPKPELGHLVEFAVNENKVQYINENVGRILGSTINVKKEVIKDGRLVHEDYGKRKLVAPLKYVLDTDTDIREYALENQISGYFLFKSEEDAMTWRCLTFQENREYRPYGIVIIKNQKVFS